MPAPADAKQPGAGTCHLGRASRFVETLDDFPPPPVEPAPGARGIEPRSRSARVPAAHHQVAACIEEHISQGTTDFARCPEQAMVIPPVQHRAAPSTHTVDRTREPRRDALHAARERLLPSRLDDQVRVIALDRVVGHSEVTALARFRQGTPPFADELAVAQRREVRSHSQGHVHRAVARDFLAPSMPDAGPRPPRPPCTRSRTSSARPHPVVGEGELLRPA